MERRSFIKNIAAIVAISQVGIIAVSSINSNDGNDGMVLQSDGEGNRQWTKLYAPVDHNHNGIYEYDSSRSWPDFN